MLRSAGMNGFGLSPSSSIRLYKLFIRPKLEYALPIMPLKKRHTTELSKCQARALKAAFSLGKRTSSQALELISGIPSISTRVQYLQLKFIHSLQSLPASFTIRHHYDAANRKNAHRPPKRSCVSRLLMADIDDKYKKALVPTTFNKEELTTIQTDPIHFLYNTIYNRQRQVFSMKRKFLGEIWTSLISEKYSNDCSRSLYYAKHVSSTEPMSLAPFLRPKTYNRAQQRAILLIILNKIPGSKRDCYFCLAHNVTATHIIECNALLDRIGFTKLEDALHLLADPPTKDLRGNQSKILQLLDGLLNILTMYGFDLLSHFRIPSKKPLSANTRLNSISHPSLPYKPLSLRHAQYYRRWSKIDYLLKLAPPLHSTPPPSHVSVKNDYSPEIGDIVLPTLRNRNHTDTVTLYPERLAQKRASLEHVAHAPHQADQSPATQM